MLNNHYSEKQGRVFSQAGMTLVELLVALSLMTLVIGAISSMVIQSMRSQQEVTADFRSQLNVRQVLYDMEKNIAEAKRRDSAGNEPIFESDLISVPSQNNTEWVTYWYTDTHPSSGGRYTIVRVVTNGMPVLPISLEAADKQLISVNSGDSEESSVERASPDAPIFTYYDANGNELAMPITDPREVRTVEVMFKSTVSAGHSQNEPTVSSTRINLRNF